MDMCTDLDGDWAPKQDWTTYETRCRQARLDQLRSLTLDDAISLYESMARFAQSIECSPEDRKRAERTRLREKIVRRHRMLDAFRALDRLHDGRQDSANSARNLRVPR